MLLRIEDTDTERNRPELIDDILAEIRWLGLDWDGEPVHQSDRLHLYTKAADELLRRGPGLLVRLHARGGPGRAPRSGRPARLRRLLPRPRPRARARARRCGSARPTRARPRSTTSSGARSAFEQRQARGLRAAAVQRHADRSCWPTSSTTPTWASPTSSAARSTSTARPSTCSSARRWASTTGRCSPTCRSWSNEKRKKLSKRRDDGVGRRVPRAGATCPRRWSTTWPLLGWGPPDGVEIRPLAEIVELFRLEDVTPSPAFFDVKKLAPLQRRVHPGARRRRRSSSAARPFFAHGEATEAVAAAAGRAGAGAGPAARRGRADGRLPLRRRASSIDDDAWQKAVVKLGDRAAAMLDAAIAELRRLRLGARRRSRPRCDGAAGGGHRQRARATCRWPRPGPGAGGGHRPHRRPAAVRVAGGAGPRAHARPAASGPGPAVIATLRRPSDRPQCRAGGGGGSRLALGLAGRAARRAVLLATWR